ncbi:hypothetical protein D6D19_10222 [Aureobasidium pullulans]|uniref:Uncharacterized protein n=1 Tax=Aureobasidium pullulans TaxID=5580 RepID=A0A4S8Z775_AURPU|nr:hypothetical protein D6D19_10222 [Aureobasidium pullulans]
MEKQPEPQTADGDFGKGDTLILEEDNARKSAFEVLFTTFQTKFQEQEGLQPANQIILRSFVFAKSEVDGFEALNQIESPEYRLGHESNPVSILSLLEA